LISFAIVALVNLLLFSWFSENDDRIDGITSLTTIFGTKALLTVLLILLAIQFFLLVQSAFDVAFLILFVMSAALASMILFARFFRNHDRYRIGDAVFFATLVYLVL
jgi:hypothetical protein